MRFTVILVQVWSLSHVVLLEPSSRTNVLDAPMYAQTYHRECARVCEDLNPDDEEPVCMMFSRYKRGYQYFVNLCHARRAICKENLLLHLVHSSRCRKTNQFFMPVS